MRRVMRVVWRGGVEVRGGETNEGVRGLSPLLLLVVVVALVVEMCVVCVVGGTSISVERIS